MGRTLFNKTMKEVYLTEEEIGYIVTGLRSLQSEIENNPERYGSDEEANNKWDEINDAICYLCEEA